LLRPTPDPEPTLPTEIPPGVTVLPDFDDMMQREWRSTDLPSYLVLNPSDVDRMHSLADAPLGYATLAVKVSDSRLVLAGYEQADDQDDTGRFRFPFIEVLRRQLEHPELRGAH